jgi:hypothetical protein
MIRRIAQSLTLAVLLTATAALAAGQPPQAQAGRYTLSGVSEGDPVCRVTLGTQMAIGGWSLDLAKDCYGKFGLSQDIAAWTLLPGGGIAFIDPLRKPLVRFEPIQAGGYVGDGPNSQPIALDREAKAPPLTVQQQLSGRWSLNQLGGQVVCRYAMTSNRAGTAGTLRAQRGCPGNWAAVVLWERGGGRLRLLDAKRRVRLTLRGDPVEGFGGDDTKGQTWGFVRD